jgi:hypothetical protein
MTTKIPNHKNKILNYFPGARGDFLASCLTNLDLNLDRYFKNVLPKSFSKIKGIEKRIVLPEVLAADLSNDFCNQILSTYMPFIQPCHFVSRLNHDDLNRLTTTHKIYQIVVQSEFYELIFLYTTIKNHFSKLQNKEELEYLLTCKQDYKVVFLSKIKKYHDDIDHKNMTLLDFKKIFYPPYEDYIRLYQEINESDPDISLFEQRLKQAELPNTIELFDTVLKIDLENYTIKKL